MSLFTAASSRSRANVIEKAQIYRDSICMPCHLRATTPATTNQRLIDSVGKQHPRQWSDASVADQFERQRLILIESHNRSLCVPSMFWKPIEITEGEREKREKKKSETVPT